jgi:hypothetical protein
MRLNQYYVMQDVERTGDEIKTYWNDYPGIYTGEIRKAMKISTIKESIMFFIWKREEAIAIYNWYPYTPANLSGITLVSKAFNIMGLKQFHCIFIFLQLNRKHGRIFFSNTIHKKFWHVNIKFWKFINKQNFSLNAHTLYLFDCALNIFVYIVPHLFKQHHKQSNSQTTHYGKQ